MEEHWYGVKCLIEHLGLSEQPGTHVYEERVILIRAPNFERAIERAEQDAKEYAVQNGAQYIHYCNAFKMDATLLADGVEVYSLMREVRLPPRDFITHYYDDGTDKGR